MPPPHDTTQHNTVLLDTNKLWPLLLVVAAGATFDVLHGGGPPAATAAELLPAAAAALVRWGAAVGALVAAVHVGVRRAIGGRVFTGTKWTVANLFRADGLAGGDRIQRPQGEAAAAAAAARAFVLRAAALLGVPPARLEAPTVTRYEDGQQQRVHFDGRPAGDPSGLPEFLAAGGQRLVQVFCYLNTLEPHQGGATKFHHPALRGLAVRPERGTALVFFPAFADGALDNRMAHSGQPVAGAGVEKWAANTWACQLPCTTAVDVCAGLGATAARAAAPAGCGEGPGAHGDRHEDVAARAW